MHKIATIFLPLLLLAGCASQPSAQRPEAPATPPKPAPSVSAPAKADTKPAAEPSYQAKGKASYYASRHHGRRTASGERLNNNAFTAAHRELPFGTRVKVTNLSNHRSVVVRITDRGPHTRGRLIDLSQAAARELGMLRAGVAQVRVESVDN
ncbi:MULTISPECIES: septal ring lytic transglycosylase RlpA family protein [unclassified Pseudomonas]|uniref:septal ring lytic transglycosylase RlpA family protein n=1 Tax=unclassified Pseudomonas TaxID=196821 RepID=UPI00244A1074|nr:MULTISPECIES: septal ring lytic transglycosylase RlpA family protein [unclassified Pseudomonas]MDG9923820.1 septal ring lytic transglycosylase RlpA family protein [Pseudomonas sp. GD04045]MDH0035905.1 septal ring lytic transglycosylase RlpA family protein [Pseudomonas sp. GD04019]